jgi:hypothetical protein
MSWARRRHAPCNTVRATVKAWHSTRGDGAVFEHATTAPDADNAPAGETAEDMLIPTVINTVRNNPTNQGSLSADRQGQRRQHDPDRLIEHD